MKPTTDIRRAAEALNRSIEARSEDLAHPGYDQLEAYVDGRLDAVACEIVETHVEDCPACAEDLADLTAMQASLPGAGQTTAPVNPWKRVAQIAAVVVAAAGVWLLMRPSATPATTPEAQAAAGTVVVPPQTQSAPAQGASVLTAEERAVVERAVAAGRIELPAVVRDLSARPGTLLGGTAPLAPLMPLTPMGTAVLSGTPKFSWRGVTEAQGYTVAVFDGQFNEVARSERVTGTSWTPSKPLPRSATLAWQVTAHTGTKDILAPVPPQPEARFLIVDEATAAILLEEQTRLKDQPLAMGVLFARAGLMSDASRELTRAVQQGDSAEQAKALLASLNQR